MAYGQRIVMHLMQTQLTFCLSDEDLELAKHAINHLRPLTELGSPSDKALTAAESLCTCILRGRMAERLIPSTPLPSTPADRPNEGPMAPLSPVPVTRPPSPVARPVVDFSF